MGIGKRVALGMSGGVDSSTAAAVLMHHGYEVVGVTCVFQDDEATRASIAGAREACRRFGIEHAVRNCVERFSRCVIEPFVRGYEKGETPSPCVGCNAVMKIPELLSFADEHGCDLVATGHYARVNQLKDSGRFAVLCGLDNRKDQSYMLALLRQRQLSRLVLPLGGMTKLQVRAFAADLGLQCADAPESQDICFAPDGYRALLAAWGVASPAGDIVDMRGAVVGSHTGLVDYTIGQRKGIGVAGPEPYYVIGKDAAENRLTIGTAHECRINAVVASGVNWQAIEGVSEPLDAMVKLRYRSTPCPCIIEPMGADRVRVALRSPQAPTAPGQHAVFYQGVTVLGGGVIEEVVS